MSSIAINLAKLSGVAALLAILTLPLRSAMAEEETPNNASTSETGFQVGVLTLIGTDLRIYHRAAGSRFLIGLRYTDYEEDFINEALVSLPNDPSDKMRTTRAGVYTDYLFHDADYYNSFFVSAALYQTTKELKCYYESNSSSATGLYFGGGYRGSFGTHFGYTIGVLVSPFVSLNTNTTTCASDEDGDFDLHLGINFRF